MNNINEEDLSVCSETEIEYYSVSKQTTKNSKIRDIIEERHTNAQNIRIPQYRDKKYICLFRGIKFDYKYFSNSNRRELNYLLSQKNNINGKTQYSSACFGNSQLSTDSVGKYLSGNTTDEENKKLHYSIRFTNAFIQFLYNNTNLSTKVNSKYFYKNLLFALLNSNTNIFSKMDYLLNQLKTFLETHRQEIGLNDKDIGAIQNAYKNFTETTEFSRTFFISTSLREETAIKYAMPFIKDNSLVGFNPEYNKNGKPKHRNAGIVEIILYPATKYKQEVEKMHQTNEKNFPQFIDLHLAKMQGILRPNTRIEEQFEATFLNKIDGKYLVASFPIYFPNFSKEYNKEYFENLYGINKKTYQEIKKLFSTEQKNNYSEAMKKIIESLTKKYTSKLKELSNKIIQQNGKINSHRFLPKIDQDIKVKLEKSQNSCTIKNRFTKQAKDNGVDNKHPRSQKNFITLISLNTSKTEKYWGFSRN